MVLRPRRRSDVPRRAQSEGKKRIKGSSILICACAMLRYLVVGTFDAPVIYVLSFDTISRELRIVQQSCAAPSAHSWLSLNARKDRLYATMWTEPPGLACYSVTRSSSSSGAPSLRLMNTVETRSRSGYCCVSKAGYVYSAGGPTGEVFRVSPEDGSFEQEAALVQRVEFVERGGKQRDDGSVNDFGGLRHGAHSADLSPDEHTLYVADMYVRPLPAFRDELKE